MVYARKLLLLRLLCNYAFCITQLAKFDFRCKITTFFLYTQPFERKKMIFQSFQYFKDHIIYHLVIYHLVIIFLQCLQSHCIFFALND